MANEFLIEDLGEYVWLDGKGPYRRVGPALGIPTHSYSPGDHANLTGYTFLKADSNGKTSYSEAEWAVSNYDTNNRIEFDGADVVNAVDGTIYDAFTVQSSGVCRVWVGHRFTYDLYVNGVFITWFEGCFGDSTRPNVLYNSFPFIVAAGDVVQLKVHTAGYPKDAHFYHLPFVYPE